MDQVLLPEEVLQDTAVRVQVRVRAIAHLPEVLHQVEVEVIVVVALQAAAQAALQAEALVEVQAEAVVPEAEDKQL
jgi:hypothetical protein